MRIASRTTALPAALSVAPVPACHESRWAPSITTSSFFLPPASSAITFRPAASSSTLTATWSSTRVRTLRSARRARRP